MIINPRITFTPDFSGATAVNVDLPETVTRYRVGPATDRSQAVSLGRKAYSVTHSAWWECEVEIKSIRPTETLTLATIIAWQTHALAGGEFSFALDRDQTFDETLAVAASQGDTQLEHTTTTVTIASGDWLCLEEVNDPFLYEWAQVATIDSSVDITLVEQINHDLSIGAIVRHRDYWPSCILSADRPVLVERDAGRGVCFDLRFKFESLR